MKVTLYLMTKKGFKVLSSIISNGYTNYISQVIIGRDANVNNDFSNEIANLCITNNIKYYDRKNDFVINSEYSLAVSWRWIIPINNSKLIILHDSLLPKYRGFAPLVNMLINGERLIGVSAIFAEKEYDKGDIILQSNTNIDYPITISEAIELITKIYVNLINSLFKKIINKNVLKAAPQNHSKATYSLWRGEEDYKINWSQSAEQILNFINAVSTPYKGAFSLINNLKVRILSAEIVPDVIIENRDVGKVIFVKNKFPIVVCGRGLLKLKNIVDDHSYKSMLPLKDFRTRLT